MAARTCQEARTGLAFNWYIPCRKPATKLIGWPDRGEGPYDMCEMCADHNLRNRGAVEIEKDSLCECGHSESEHTGKTPENDDCTMCDCLAFEPQESE